MSDIGWRFQVPSQQFFYRVVPTWLKIASFLGFWGGSPINFGGISTKMGSPRTLEWLPPCTSYWGLGACGFGRDGWNLLLGKDGPKKLICFKAIGFASHSIELFKRDLYPTNFPKQVKHWCLRGGCRKLLQDACFGIFLYSANLD